MTFDPSDVLHGPSGVLHDPSGVLHDPSDVLHGPSSVLSSCKKIGAGHSCNKLEVFSIFSQPTSQSIFQEDVTRNLQSERCSGEPGSWQKLQTVSFGMRSFGLLGHRQFPLNNLTVF